jgi:hypothetical protein
MEIDEEDVQEFKFNETIWFQICKYLDEKSLIAMSETSHFFNDLIRRTSIFTQKLHLRLKNLRKDNLPILESVLTRNYQNLSIKDLKDTLLSSRGQVDPRKTFFSILENLKSSVTFLNLVNNYIQEKDLIKTLKPFDNLHTLHINNLQLADNFTPFEWQTNKKSRPMLDMPNLRDLKLHSSDFVCMIILKNNTNLISLDISSPSYSRDDIVELENFLLAQKKLKILKLNAFRFNSSYSTSRLANVPFQLDELWIRDVSWDIYTHGVLFFKSQTNLKQFKLSNFQKMIVNKEQNYPKFHEFMQHILINNPLKCVEIDTRGCHPSFTDDEFLCGLQNNNVTELTYLATSSDETELWKSFVRIFPNIEKLTYASSSENAIELIKRLSQLQRLNKLELKGSLQFIREVPINTAQNLIEFSYTTDNEIIKSFAVLQQMLSVNCKIQKFSISIEPLLVEQIFELTRSFASTLQQLEAHDLFINMTEANLIVKQFPRLQSIGTDVNLSKEVLDFLANTRIKCVFKEFQSYSHYNFVQNIQF